MSTCLRRRIHGCLCGRHSSVSLGQHDRLVAARDFACVCVVCVRVWMCVVCVCVCMYVVCACV